VPAAPPPFPPLPLRQTVGIEDLAFFDNPTGALIFGEDVAPERYRRVLDFGCGCGRVARQLLMQGAHRPEYYLGLDLHRPSIDWCAADLSAFDPKFEFQHLDIFNAGLNPLGKRHPIRFSDRGPFSLVNAHSVFTHILEPEVGFYFDQCVRALEPGGVLRATWFLFDKALYPMMQEFQNCLYINPDDLTNATIYDTAFVRRLYRDAGLRMYRVVQPFIRGFQWLIYAEKAPGEDAEFPQDTAPVGLARPPIRVQY
jgi:SAM-dependent methyltransferase